MALARISLPGINDSPGESVWATDLGNNLFRVENIPFFRHDVHFEDIVRCTPRTLHSLPVMTEVVKRSGNATLSMGLRRRVDPKTHLLFLKLKHHDVSGEGAAGIMYSMNIPPTTSIQTIKGIVETEADVAEYIIYSPPQG